MGYGKNIGLWQWYKFPLIIYMKIHVQNELKHHSYFHSYFWHTFDSLTVSEAFEDHVSLRLFLYLTQRRFICARRSVAVLSVKQSWNRIFFSSIPAGLLLFNWIISQMNFIRNISIIPEININHLTHWLLEHLYRIDAVTNEKNPCNQNRFVAYNTHISYIMCDFFHHRKCNPLRKCSIRVWLFNGIWTWARWIAFKLIPVLCLNFSFQGE